MFTAVVFYEGLYGLTVGTPTDQNNGRSKTFATIEEAKKAVDNYVSQNQVTFKSGYTAYIIDRENDKIVSTAKMPLPTLAWQDAG